MIRRHCCGCCDVGGVTEVLSCGPCGGVVGWPKVPSVLGHLFEHHSVLELIQSE